MPDDPESNAEAMFDAAQRKMAGNRGPFDHLFFMPGPERPFSKGKAKGKGGAGSRPKASRGAKKRPRS